MLESIYHYLGISTGNVLYYTGTFKYPIFDVRLYSYRFIMMQSDLNFLFFLVLIFVWVYLLYMLYVYVYKIVFCCVYIYIHLIYCIHMCFTCLFYRICIH